MVKVSEARGDAESDVEEEAGSVRQNIVPDANRQVHWKVYQEAIHEPFEDPEHVGKALLFEVVVQCRQPLLKQSIKYFHILKAAGKAIFVKPEGPVILITLRI